MKLFLLFVLLVSSFSTAQAQTPVDFDEDGVSDALFTSASGSELRWQSDPSSVEGSAIDENFGLSTDRAIPAHWNDEVTSSLATVRESSYKLIWRLYIGSGELQLKEFGKSGDVIISGADFDGNQFSDAAIVRPKGRKLLWRVYFNIFTDESRIQKFIFGKVGDRVTFLNFDGTRDWAAAFGAAPNRSGRLLLQNLVTREKHNFRGFPKALVRSPRPRPLPISSEEGVDALCFVSEDESDTTFKVYSPEGEKISEKTLTGIGRSIIGNYDGDSDGEEILFQNSSVARVYNPFVDVVLEQAKMNGTPVGETNIYITTAPTPTPLPTPTATVVGEEE